MEMAITWLVQLWPFDFLYVGIELYVSVCLSVGMSVSGVALLNSFIYSRVDE